MAEYLLLEVVSEQASVMGNNRWHVFGAEGGRIGRDPKYADVLPISSDDMPNVTHLDSQQHDWKVGALNEYISRHHLTIRYINRIYWVECLSQEPIAINHRDAKKPSKEPHPIGHGDQLFMDDYIIKASIIDEAEARRLEELKAIQTPVPPDELVPPVTPQPIEPPVPPPQPQEDGTTRRNWWEENDPPHDPQSSPETHVLKGAPEESVDLIGELLNAAGIGALRPTMTAEEARQIGAVLRESVRGAISVLEDRNKLVNEFRLPKTRIKRADNNPLRFAEDLDSAMRQLFLSNATDYLPPFEAMKAAMADIQAHQSAVLAAMHAAYKRMLGQLSPARLQARVGKAGRGVGLMEVLGSNKSRLWEEFVAQHEGFAADPDHAFRKLFGSEFARVYEEEWLRQKAARSAQHRAGGRE